MISGKTQLVGLLGWPVSHSFSPAMHNAAAAELGLDLVYVPLPVRPENLPAAIRGLAALGFVGVNVTVPHKEAVIPLLSEVDAAAKVIGAVNTISFQPPAARSQPSADSGQQSAVGYNTDAAGFLADLDHIGLAIAGRECLILGAGGSARAVAYGLASAGGNVRLFARRLEQARKLAADLSAHFEAARLSAHSWEKLKETRDVREALIVNTTPLGMTPEVTLSPWPDALLFPPKAIVYDLVYNPSETRLVAQARAAGCRVATGLGMLLRQGALAFELWTGREPDTNVMRAALPRF